MEFFTTFLMVLSALSGVKLLLYWLKKVGARFKRGPMGRAFDYPDAETGRCFRRDAFAESPHRHLY